MLCFFTFVIKPLYEITFYVISDHGGLTVYKSYVNLVIMSSSISCPKFVSNEFTLGIPKKKTSSFIWQDGDLNPQGVGGVGFFLSSVVDNMGRFHPKRIPHSGWRYKILGFFGLTCTKGKENCHFSI